MWKTTRNYEVELLEEAR